MEKKTKNIQINGNDIVVDENCADMVLFFNKIGLKTVMCCEGHIKPIYRIWFDVDDETMNKFLNKVENWTDVAIRPTNEEKTKFETYRIKRGLQGWIYKRYWISEKSRYFPEGHKETWVYQAEGRTSIDAIMQAKKDLATMKAIYYGTNLEKIQQEQEKMGQALIEMFEARAI